MHTTKLAANVALIMRWRSTRLFPRKADTMVTRMGLATWSMASVTGVQMGFFDDIETLRRKPVNFS